MLQTLPRKRSVERTWWHGGGAATVLPNALAKTHTQCTADAAGAARREPNGSTFGNAMKEGHPTLDFATRNTTPLAVPCVLAK